MVPPSPKRVWRPHNGKILDPPLFGHFPGPEYPGIHVYAVNQMLETEWHTQSGLLSHSSVICSSHIITNMLLYTSGPVSPQERLLYILNKLFVKQVKSFLLILDLDPFILLNSPHNIKYIKSTSP